MPGFTPQHRTSAFSTQSSSTTTGHNNYGSTSTFFSQTSSPGQSSSSGEAPSSSQATSSDTFATLAHALTTAASAWGGTASGASQSWAPTPVADVPRAQVSLANDAQRPAPAGRPSFVTQARANTTGLSGFGGLASTLSQTPEPVLYPASGTSGPTIKEEQGATSSPSFTGRPRRHQAPQVPDAVTSGSPGSAGRRSMSTMGLGAGAAGHTLADVFAPSTEPPASAALRRAMGSAALAASEAAAVNAGVNVGRSYVKPVVRGIMKATPVMASVYQATRQPRNVRFVSEINDDSTFDSMPPPPPRPPRARGAAPASGPKARPIKRFAQAVWQNMIWLLALAAVIAYALYRRQAPTDAPVGPNNTNAPLDFRGGRPLN